MNPEAPDHLSEASKGIWSDTLDEFELSSTELAIFRLALEALDRCDLARLELAVSGLVIKDRYGGPRVNPWTVVERDSRLAAARLLKQLGLEAPEPPRSPMALKPRNRWQRGA
jgi:phage terminase small subunit